MEDKRQLLSIQDVKAEFEAFEEIPDDKMRIVVRDLFSVGCCLRLMGERVAGTKACLAALTALSLPGHISKKILRLLDDGNVFRLGRSFAPHSEIRDVLERLGKQ